MNVYRLAPGTVHIQTFLDDTTNVITSFPVQSDQSASYPWLLASDDIVPAGTARVQALDGSWGRFGQLNTTIRFAVLTQEMWNYLMETFFGKAASPENSQPNESAAVTVQLRDRLATGAEEWVVYHATMILPERTPESLSPHAGVYQTDVPFPLIRMSLAADAVGFTRGFSLGHNA